MTSDGGIESRADGSAISNAFRQSHVELGDIVARVRRHPFRHPAIFGGNGQIGECRVIISRRFKVQFLALHGSTRSGRELEVATFPMDLEQKLGSAPQAAPDLKGYDRTVSDNAIDDELVGGSLCDHLVCSLERDAVALAHHEGGKFLEAAMISRARFLLIAGVALVPLASVWSAGIFSTGEARS
jgi:hypothetical protein